MIGVLGDGQVAETVLEAVADDATVAAAGDATVPDDADAVVADDADGVLAAGPDLVVAVGEDAVVALAGAGASVPVLPVAAGSGMRSVPAGDAATAVPRAAAGAWTAEERPVLAVEADDRGWPALFDAFLVTDEPVRISEYGVETGNPAVADPSGAGPATSGRTTVGRFRADGVVVATPAGSLGYARAAGGPLVAPAAGSVVVVPVAPFTTDRPTWVLDLPVTLTVERGETAVAIAVDGDDCGTVPTGAAVTIRRGWTLTLATVPESRPFFEEP